MVVGHGYHVEGHILLASSAVEGAVLVLVLVVVEGPIGADCGTGEASLFFLTEIVKSEIHILPV